MEFPNPPLQVAGHFWIKPSDPTRRLAHLVKGRLPAGPSPIVRALATVCGLEDLEGRAWHSVHASAACATCVDRTTDRA